MLDAIPRPDLDPTRYRELEIRAMQIATQLPHEDIGEVLLVMDILENVVRRWQQDERMAQHQPAKAIADEINRNNIVRLLKD